jgi:fatty acid desaturase
MIDPQIFETETTEPESTDPQIEWVTVALLAIGCVACIVLGIMLCFTKLWTGVIACVIFAILFGLAALNTVMCAGENPYKDIA